MAKHYTKLITQTARTESGTLVRVWNSYKSWVPPDPVLSLAVLK